jgi:tetratricopeptide (TPR) repeat protein
VPLRSAYEFAWIPALRAAPGLVLCLALAGCLTTPLDQREWVEVRTRHYDVWSALGLEESAQLAADLEYFRSAAEFISGRALPAPPLATRVFAFDDRGVGRVFSYEGQRAYLLSRQPGDVIVLRTGGGWDSDAWTAFKLEYARRLLWNASAEDLPPWLDEGLPQLASTLEARSDGAHAGNPPRYHVRMLRDSQWIPFDRLLGGADLAGWSQLEREILGAESWAVCQYLAFGADPKVIPAGALARYRARIDEGISPGDAARGEFGDLGKLQHDVWRMIRGEEIGQGTLRIKLPGTSPQPRAVPRPEVLEQLGGLAIAIGKQKLAEKFLDAAHEHGAGSAESLASWGDLLESNGDRSGADARYQAALVAAPDDPLIPLRYANLLRARAEHSSVREERTELAGLARTHYASSIERLDGLGESHAGLAATYLVDGVDPAGSLAHARAARELLPGDAEVGLIAAKLELAVGDREAARRAATRAMTRARNVADLDAAQSVLALIDERASIR